MNKLWPIEFYHTLSSLTGIRNIVAGIYAIANHATDNMLHNTREEYQTDFKYTQIGKFMGPTWGPPESCRPQMGPMLAPWTLLSRYVYNKRQYKYLIYDV